MLDILPRMSARSDGQTSTPRETGPGAEGARRSITGRQPSNQPLGSACGARPPPPSPLVVAPPCRGAGRRPAHGARPGAARHRHAARRLVIDAQAGTPARSVATSVRQGTFDFESPGSPRDAGHLMKALNAVNARWGCGTLKIASTQAQVPRHDEVATQWTGKQERRIPAYTTCWSEMPVVRT